MTEGRRALDVQQMRRAMVDQTSRLVDFLRELARTGQPLVRDVEKYDVARWLTELRSPEIDVDLNLDAGPGDVVFSLDPVVSEPPPSPPDAVARWLDRGEIEDSSSPCPELSDDMPDDEWTTEALDLYDAWADRWGVWAEADRRIAPRRGWFDTLAVAARRIEQQDDVYELVLGTGLLSWIGANTIRHPLLTTPVELRTDRATGRIDLALTANAATRICDRVLLEGEEAFDGIRSQVIREELRSSEARPLADEMKDLLARWRSLALDRAHPYDHTWEPTERAEPAADVRFAPALILRERDRTSLIDYFDRMLAALSGPEAEAPLGLAQLLTALEPEDRMEWLVSEGAASGDVVGGDPLFPLPSNPEQRQIIERLVHDNGVVVQGPPGTGKTHTIANLLSALLARGQRVLVTSEKAQALRVLREKLPPELQRLCVSLTDVGRGGSTELDESVTALSDRYSQFSPAGHRDKVRELTSVRDNARQRVKELTERVRGLRESETYVHPPVAAGYEGTKGRIADRLRAEKALHDWIPVPFPAGAPFEPPLGPLEMVELRRLLASGTPARRARVRQVLPDLGSLLTPVAVQQLVASEAAAASTAREAAHERSLALSSLTEEDLVALRGLVRQVAERLHALGLDGEPAGWPGTWTTQALADGFAGREMAVWRNLGAVAGHAALARDQLASLGLRRVSLPQFDEAGSNSVVGQLDAGRALRAHLAAGNPIKRRMRPQVQKRAEHLLDGASVDGIPVTTGELLDLVLARLDAEHAADALIDRWAAVQVHVDRSVPLEMRVPRLVDLATDLQRVLAVVDVLGQARALLASRSVLVPLRTPQDWRDLATSLAAVEARLGAERATEAIAAQVSRLELESSSATAPPELSDMARALAARDVAYYNDAIQRLAGASAEQDEQRRCDALWEKLSGAHPVLADHLARTAQHDGWDGALSRFTGAWAWGKAWTFFEALRQPGLEETLAAQLDEATAQVGRATAALAAEEAWGRCLERMSAHQEQALRAYKSNMADRGSGYGRWAHRYAAAARQAMVEARGAVPAWIMPLREVVETIPPDANSFDVVIVDEASQARIEALFLLWLAPRVIVVGDERQCAPSQVAHGRLQPIFDRLDDYLHDLPEYLRLGFTPKSNLFGLLSNRFGSVIRLREHFRCMPEIIGWSSGTFYRDEPLVPLRQYGADRLLPIRTVYVPSAVAEGNSSRIRNRLEAEAIVAHIKACIADPAYADKTFGVVVLQGQAQVRLIDDLLQAEIPQAEREQRRLRVGSPPDFQGDERHVVFVSMVIADRHSALTHREWQRRFNVAASRAQDQMWLFHSVTVDLLSPRDLRRSLLTYALNPPTDLDNRVFDDLEWTSERRDPFDSVFEQRVYIALRDRGYRVTPQYEVNGRRIDLVVTGAKGRLAVECDGDYWHTGHEAQLADIDRQMELQRAGWRFWRVRESEFYLDPAAALDPLWAELEKRGITPGDFGSSATSTASARASTSIWEPIELSEEEAGADPDDVALLDIDGWQSSSTDTRGLNRGASPAHLGRSGDVPGSVPAREVRRWAASLGLPVGQRGRLHPDVIEAWNRANPDRPYRR